MGAVNVIDRFAAWRRACRMSIAAAALLAAAPAAAQDTVRVEWAVSPDRSLVILNAYAVRGSRPVPESVQGLLIERDPAAADTTRYALASPEAAYASVEARPFLEALGVSEDVLDELANGSKGSDVKGEFDVQEWKRLLERLLVDRGMEIRQDARRVIVRPVAEPVLSLAAADLAVMFGARDPHPVLPHLKSGLVALSGGSDPGRRPDVVDFGPIAVADTGNAGRFLVNYGVRPVETELGLSEGAEDAGFSAGGVQTLLVPPGDSVPVSLLFIPKQAGPQDATLEFRIAGEEEALQVSLTGEGTSPGLFARSWEWMMARLGWLLAILAGAIVVILIAAAVAARNRGVRLALPRFGRGATVPTPVPPTTGWQPDQPATPPALLATRPDDASTRWHLVSARQAIEDLLAALDGEPGSADGGREADDGGARGGGRGRKEGRAAEDLRQLRKLEREREEQVAARARLDDRVRELTAEGERLNGELRTLEADHARLAQQVTSLSNVQTENTALARQKAEAEESLAAARRDVTRLAGEQGKLGARLHAVAGVLELSDEMVSDAGWPETQRRLPELRDGGKPRYLWAFEQLVADLTAIFDEIAPRAGAGRLGAAVNAVLAGSNNNAGLRTVAAELERSTLAGHMGLAHPRELRTLPAERFYRHFVDRRFRPVIDNIAKLGLYARSRSPEIGMGQRLFREGVDPALLERALALIETRMRLDFGVEVHMVQLFEERFDGTRHETASHSTLRHTLPDLEASIRRLPPDTIYDITSVGLRSDRLGVSVRPVVAWVASR